MVYVATLTACPGPARPTSIPPEYLQQESDGSYDEGEYDYYVN